MQWATGESRTKKLGAMELSTCGMANVQGLLLLVWGGQHTFDKIYNSSCYTNHFWFQKTSTAHQSCNFMFTLIVVVFVPKPLPP